ncbi:MAG: 3-dehydroquinate synthase [Elusimicrobiota bacterium]
MEIKLKIKRTTHSFIKILENLNLKKELSDLDYDKLVIVADSMAKPFLKRKINSYPVFELQPLSNKNLSELSSILNFFAKNKLTRNSIVLAFGGGKVSDIVGLASSLYMRGIRWISVPTTFLSQIDASIGGKTAIDFNGIKNLLGTFHFPVLVLIDWEFPLKQNKTFFNGIGEMVKYILITPQKTSEKLKKLLPSVITKNPQAIKSSINLCVKFKTDIVQKDPFDSNGKREILNFGHTPAHAFEKLYDISHGDAVYYGVIYEVLLSKNLGLINYKKEKFSEIFKIYEPAFPFKKSDFKRFSELITYDKKNKGSNNYFLVLKKKKIKPAINIDPSILSKTYEELCEKKY